MIPRARTPLTVKPRPGQFVDEWRVGRNFIRRGDTVRVLPSKVRGRDGYESRVRAIEIINDEPYFEVIRPFNGGVYLLPLARIQRKAQTRKGFKEEAEVCFCTTDHCGPGLPRCHGRPTRAASRKGRTDG